MTYDISDLYDTYEFEKEKEWERWVERLPICAICGDPITDDTCYLVDGDYICETCIEECCVSTPHKEE